jgi:hypothetical protein
MASAPFETEEGPRRATVLRYPTRASESGQPSSLAAASSRAQPINPSRRQRRTDKPAPTLETGHENQTAALSAVSALRADLEGHKAQWNQERQAELRIAADWPQREALAQSLQNDQTRLGVLATDQRANNAALTLANEQLQAVTAEVEGHHSVIDALESRDRGLKDAEAQAQPLLQQYLQTLGVADLDAETAFAIVDGEGSDRTRATRLTNLREVLTDLPTALLQRQNLEIRKREYEAASAAAPSAAAISVTRQSLDSAAEHVAALRAAYDRAAGPFEQLRHLSRTVIEALGHDESTCPVCAHDWKSASALRQALNDASRATPASLAALDQQLRDAQAQHQTMQAQLMRDNQLLAGAVEAERAYRPMEASLAAFATKVRQAGLEADDAQLQSNAERAIARINLVSVLRALREEARATETAVAHTAPANSSIIRL